MLSKSRYKVRKAYEVDQGKRYTHLAAIIISKSEVAEQDD